MPASSIQRLLERYRVGELQTFRFLELLDRIAPKMKPGSADEDLYRRIQEVLASLEAGPRVPGGLHARISGLIAR